MLIYIITIALTTMLAWLYSRTTRSGKVTVFVLMVLIPGLVAGLRGVGTDHLLYQLRFEELAVGAYEITDFSLIYLLMELIQKLGGNYQLVTMIISVTTVAVTFYTFTRYENKISVTMAVFSFMTMFYLMSFNIFRQILATAFLMLAFYHLYEKENKLHFALLAILTFLIHSAVGLFSLVCFVRPLLEKEKFRKLRIIGYVALAVLIMALPLLAKAFSFLAAYFPHYAYYFLNFSYTGISIGIFRYLILCIFPLVCVTYLTGSFPFRIPDKMQSYAVLSILGTLLWLASYVSTSYLYRIGYVGLASLPLLHGAFWKNITPQTNEHLVCKAATQCVLVVILIFFFFYDFMYLNSGDVYPYQFFWQI